MKQLLLFFFLLSRFLFANSQKSYHEENIEKYTDSIQLSPKNAKYHFERGYNYYSSYKNPNYDLAFKDLSKAILLNPKYIDAYYWRALCLTKLKKYDLVIKDYTTAINLGTKDLTTYNFRATTYEKLKKYDLAISDYSTVIRLGFNNRNEDDLDAVGYAFSCRGDIYYDQKKYNLAIKDYTSRIENDDATENFDETYNTFFMRGNCYFNLTQYKLAIADYKVALEIKPDLEDAITNLNLATSRLEGSSKSYKTFSIDSKTSYTTIKVSKGDVINIQASGSILVGTWAGSSTPDGIDGYTNYNRVQGFRHASLLARVGDNDQWQFIGVNKTITAINSGLLEFIVNDGDPSNNTGSYTVNISIQN